MFLGDSLLSWRNKKHEVVSLYSIEAEYRTMAITTKEVVHVRHLLADLGIRLSAPTPLHFDNQSVI